MRKLLVLNHENVRLVCESGSETECCECFDWMRRLLDVEDEVVIGETNADLESVDLRALAIETCRVLIKRKWI